MKFNMQYVILIVFIFGLQMLFYTHFRYYEKGLQSQTTAFNRLQSTNAKLQLEIHSLKLNSEQQRRPASISDKQRVESEPIDMSEFYFSKAREYQKKNQPNLALGVLDKIKNNSLNSDNRSKALFHKILIGCQKSLEDFCIKDIETLVTQYPESDWTGKALSVLANYYANQKKFDESNSLKKIIKSNFAKKNETSVFNF